MLVQMDFRSVLSTVFRQAWKFLLVFIPVVVIGLLYAMTATKYHASTAKLIVKFGQDARPEMVMGNANSLTAEEKRGMVQSNVNILGSRDIYEELLKRVGVEKVYPSLADEDLTPEVKMDAAIRQLGQDIKVVTESDAGVINLSILHPDAKVGQELITGLVEIFIRRQAEIYGNPQTEVLQEQAGAARERLEQAASELSAFRLETGIASIDEELTLLLEQRASLAGYLSRRETSVKPSEASGVSVDESDYEQGDDEAVETAPAKSTSSAAPLPARIGIANDSSRFPVVEDTQRRIDELRAREAELLLTYRPDSTAVRAVRKNIALEQAALNRSVDALNEQINDLDRQIAEKQRHRAGYDDLNRGVENAQEAYTVAQERLRAAEVNNDLTQRNITRISVVEQPTTSYRPVKPQKTLIFLMCLAIGMTLGLAVSVGTELVDSTFSRPEQLANELKTPVLANFPNWNAKNVKSLPPPRQWRQNVGDMIKARKVPSIYRADNGLPKNLPVDDLVGVYQSIKSAAGNDAAIVNFTSCQSGEGVTTIGREFSAIAAGMLGQSVLFVTLTPDSRSARPGASLHDAAAGRANLKEALTPFHSDTHKLSHAHLMADASADMLIADADKFSTLMEELKRNFSLIVIATPALAARSAGVSLGRLADAVVVVVEAERTRAPVVRQAVGAMRAAGVKLAGSILNKQLYYIPGWLYSRL